MTLWGCGNVPLYFFLKKIENVLDILYTVCYNRSIERRYNNGQALQEKKKATH